MRPSEGDTVTGSPTPGEELEASAAVGCGPCGGATRRARPRSGPRWDQALAQRAHAARPTRLLRYYAVVERDCLRRHSRSNKRPESFRGITRLHETARVLAVSCVTSRVLRADAQEQSAGSISWWPSREAHCRSRERWSRAGAWLKSRLLVVALGEVLGAKRGVLGRKVGGYAPTPPRTTQGRAQLGNLDQLCLRLHLQSASVSVGKNP